jgi:hypothetical protein
MTKLKEVGKFKEQLLAFRDILNKEGLASCSRKWTLVEGVQNRQRKY